MDKKKLLIFDTETTGIDKKENDIIQIAGVIDINNETVDSFNIRMRPINPNNVSQEAIETHGISLEEMMSWQTPQAAKLELTNKLAKHVNKYDKTDKFWLGGYNLKFDIDFLAFFFEKMGDKYLGSWINWRYLDPLPFLMVHKYLGMLRDIPDLKLETVCKHYGIVISNAHDALADVLATKELIYKVIL